MQIIPQTIAGRKLSDWDPLSRLHHLVSDPQMDWKIIWEGSIHGDTQKWMVYNGKSYQKWMRTGGTYFRKPPYFPMAVAVAITWTALKKVMGQAGPPLQWNKTGEWLASKVTARW